MGERVGYSGTVLIESLLSIQAISPSRGWLAESIILGILGVVSSVN